MAINPLERPGVQVVQTFQTTSATILVPTLPACIMGACNQVVEAVDDSGAFVSDAQIVTPARLTAGWVSTPFQYTALGTEDLGIVVNNGVEQVVTFSTGPALTVDEVVDEINSVPIVGAMASVEISGSQKRLVITTTATGDNASLQVGPSTTSAAASSLSLPIGYTDAGSSGYSNYIKLNLQKADYPDPRSNIDELTIDYDTVRVFLNNGAGVVREVLRTESFLTGATSAVTVQDDGDGDNLSPYLNFATTDFTTSPAAAVATGNVDIVSAAPDLVGKILRMTVDGNAWQTLVFPTTATGTAIRDAINVLWPAVASLSGNFLRLTSPSSNGGVESEIRIDKTVSNMLSDVGLTGAGAPFNSTDLVSGVAFKPMVGDEVWVDGIRLGLITEVSSAAVNRLRLDSEQLLTYTGATWYVVAKGLDNSASSATRPSSDLRVDANTGTVIIKQELFRDSAGLASAAGPLSTYLAYTALRTDVSRLGDGFNLLRYGSTTDLSDALSPLDTQNPLGLGMYFAILNAPGIEVTGVGVEATSSTEPDGTLDAYIAAFEFLESKDVYAIAPLTHSNDVGQVAQAHADAMSEPENGLERVVILNPTRPTRATDTLVASGIGNVSGVPTDNVQSGIANLQSLLAALGLPGPTYTEDDGVFIEFEDDTNKYLVQSVSGAVVTINDGPLTSTNDFYYDVSGGDVFTTVVVDTPFTVKVRGEAISTRTDEASAYGEIAQGYADRRVIVTAPDQTAATIDGLETVIDGYYLSAGLAGMTSAREPQAPFTEEAITGFTRTIGSNDRYSETQLKIMCGGGLWVFYQEGSGPVRVRHQLTSDMSTIEKREYSITKALDFAAKLVRSTTRNFIGHFNITSNVRDAISTTLSGIKAFLVPRVFAGFDVQAIRQDADAPDTLLVDVDITVYYPLNKLRVTFVV